MARTTLQRGHHRRLVLSSSAAVVSSPAILHAAWIAALVGVCLALCTIHSRRRRLRPPSSSSFSSSKSSSSRRRGHGAASTTRRRPGQGDEGGSVGGGGSTAAAASTPPAKVSPTPSDSAAKQGNGRVDGGETQAAETRRRGAGDDDRASQDGAASLPVTVIDVGTHGPIAPAFLPAPDPLPPRRSLSVKHMRLAERLGSRIRSTRWGRDDDHGDGGDDEDAGGSEPAPEGSTLWTKTIILGERCRVGDDEDGDHAVVRWKSYRPRQPRSMPMTRSNSFAGVGTLG